MTDSKGLIDRFEIEIKEHNILRLIGYKRRNIKIDDSVRQLIIEVKKSLYQYLQPAALFRILDYEQTNKHPIFKDAKKVALCLCTIGSRLEDEVARLMDGNELLKALILDAFGSEAVEEVAIQSDLLLAKKAREMGLWPSKRFSPGYGSWHLKEQHFIFRMLPAHEIGVRLNQVSCMMIPRKSISFRLNFYEDKSLTKRKIFF